MSKDKILIVYSEEDIRNMLEIYFTGYGYDVICIGDTGTMLEFVTPENIPDAMVVELNDATSFGREIRQTLQHKTLLQGTQGDLGLFWTRDKADITA
jgi:DNA-binding response OmpR family regulator